MKDAGTIKRRFHLGVGDAHFVVAGYVSGIKKLEKRRPAGCKKVSLGGGGMEYFGIIRGVASLKNRYKKGPGGEKKAFVVSCETDLEAELREGIQLRQGLFLASRSNMQIAPRGEQGAECRLTFRYSAQPGHSPRSAGNQWEPRRGEKRDSSKGERIPQWAQW